MTKKIDTFSQKIGKKNSRDFQNSTGLTLRLPCFEQEAGLETPEVQRNLSHSLTLRHISLLALYKLHHYLVISLHAYA